MDIYIGCFKIQLQDSKKIDLIIDRLNDSIIILDMPNVSATRIYCINDIINIEIHSKVYRYLNKDVILTIKKRIQNIIKQSIVKFSFSQQLYSDYIKEYNVKEEITLIQRFINYFFK